MKQAFLKVPWWGFVVAAVGIFCVSIVLGLLWGNPTISDQRSAVKIEEFRPGADVGPNSAVNVRAMVDYSRSFRFENRAADGTSKLYQVFALFPASKEDAGNEMMAALILNEAEGSELESYIKNNFVAMGAVGPVLDIPGTVPSVPSMTRLAQEHATFMGVTTDARFFLIRPNLSGAPVATSSAGLAAGGNLFRIIAIALLIVGVVKYAMFRFASRNSSAGEAATGSVQEEHLLDDPYSMKDSLFEDGVDRNAIPADAYRRDLAEEHGHSLPLEEQEAVSKAQSVPLKERIANYRPTIKHGVIACGVLFFLVRPWLVVTFVIVSMIGLAAMFALIGLERIPEFIEKIQTHRSKNQPDREDSKADQLMNKVAAHIRRNEELDETADAGQDPFERLLSETRQRGVYPQ